MTDLGLFVSTSSQRLQPSFSSVAPRACSRSPSLVFCFDYGFSPFTAPTWNQPRFALTFFHFNLSIRVLPVSAPAFCLCHSPFDLSISVLLTQTFCLRLSFHFPLPHTGFPADLHCCLSLFFPALSRTNLDSAFQLCLDSSLSSLFQRCIRFPLENLSLLLRLLSASL